MTTPDMTDLNALSPSDLAGYLAGSGWLERQHVQHASIWTIGEGEGEFELLLPLDPQFRDYHARLRDALRTIALNEDRDTREVLADVTAATVDTQHFRLLPNLPSGSISLIDIVDVTRGVRDLMYAAAHSTTSNEPMLVQPRPRPPEVNRFVRGVRLAAPKSGSFVLSAQVPLHSEPVEMSSHGNPPPSRQPFNRRVVLKLHQAISATHVAADEAIRHDSLTAFADRVDEGVSANLCEAVGLVGKAQPFDLRFAWAQSMPLSQAAATFSFDRRHISVIQEAAQELPRLAAESEVVLVARVIRLERVGDGAGRVILRGALQRPPGYVSDVSITATLPPHLYDIAVIAHRDRRQIKIVGRLRGTEVDQVRVVEFSNE